MSRNDNSLYAPQPSTLSSLTSAANGTLSIAKEVVMTPFSSDHRRSESIRILSDLAPTLMQSKYSRPVSPTPPVGLGRPSASSSRYPLLRLPTTVPGAAALSSAKPSSTALQILERADALSRLSLDTPAVYVGEEPAVSLIQGFRATIPSSELPKQRRRMVRGEIVDEDIGSEKLGLKKLGDRARGLLTEGGEPEDEGQDAGRKSRRRRKKRESRRHDIHHESKLHLEDLVKHADEIAQDKENLRIRQSIIHAEIFEVAAKIDALAEIRRRLEASLLKLQEEGLELDDELEGVQELMTSPNVTSRSGTKALPSTVAQPQKSSRRRKGPAFLPSEHDELPSGVAFMTINAHAGGITALDFDEPYGMLVTAGNDDVVKVWDLCDGEEIGQLRGHKGLVKAVQVEDTLCFTGGADGAVRLWDLRLVEDYEERIARASEQEAGKNPLDRIAERQEEDDYEDAANGAAREASDEGSPCRRVLEGHSKSVTSLYYEDTTLVTGSADKTIRQWDVTTGQCVQTMDILWAISNPPAQPTASKPKSRLSHRASMSFGSVQYDDLLPSPGGGLSTSPPNSLLSAATSANFAVATPPFADGTWDMYQDFVGGLQFWGYALASGSGDGAVRMWDMRTGQAHRTLLGHTSPVTCLQFDETNLVSGSLDKTIRIWDLRMGQVAELHRYEYPVTALQFDSRKVVACVGENGVEVYNRTTNAHTRLVVNGHTKPAERMRFIDKYLVSGGREGCAKVWAM
ncbi:Mitochondrial fission protein [Vanrija albida]|uniref:Mitochondrial fission protein n=1 Tax=Vanrija albida TaxID=181172 RepID=A0ABR3QBA2_9TREE